MPLYCFWFNCTWASSNFRGYFEEIFSTSQENSTLETNVDSTSTESKLSNKDIKNDRESTNELERTETADQVHNVEGNLTILGAYYILGLNLSHNPKC